MGGTWDSTNIADGDVAVFTPIDLDHADRLGNTITEIANTKAGIIKPGAIVVSAAQKPEVQVILSSKAKETAERFVVAGKDFDVLDTTPSLVGQNFSLKGLAGNYEDMFMPIHGEHQTANAAVALAAVEAFLGNGERRILDDIVRVSFADVASPGRLQVIDREPLTILDGAHNPHGVRSLAHALKHSFAAPKSVGVIGILAGKNADQMLETLSQSFAKVIITSAKTDRAIEAEELATLASKYWGSDVEVASSVAKAYQLAKETITRDGLDAIVFTGSLSVVGEVLALIQED
jgi:dihydrofolate synthase/folylpolyglutamate synthase